MKTLILTAGVLLCAVACTSNKGTTTGNPVVSEDSSASGAAAQAVGGALSSSGANGTLDFTKPEPSRSLSAGTCPDYTSTGSDCTSDTTTMWLRYQSCTFSSSNSVWHGTQAIILSSGTPACGSFPNPGASGTLYRQFVSAPGSATPYAMIITSRYSTIGAVDDHAADLANFDGQTLPALVNGGYGDKVVFGAGGQRTSVTLAHRIAVVNAYDHSVYGTLTITESTAAGTNSRTVNGQVDVYHNGLKVVGTSTFTNVVHSDTCCLPISGKIQTLFNHGQNVSPVSGLGDAMVGRTETLEFTGCGTADLTSYDGTTRSVALSRCY